MTPLEEVTALRAQLWDAGFRPVPVHNAKLGDDTSGKNPLGKGWQHDARKDPPFCVANPAVDRALNTGILCDGLRAIDIDIDDPEMARRCCAIAMEMLGEAPVRTRSGSARCLLVYRAAAGEPHHTSVTGDSHSKQVSCRIQVLGKGQQFVAAGMHYSGATLQWFPDPPWAELREALPPATEEQILAVLTACAQVIGASPPGTDGGDHIPGAPQADPLRIAAAMADITNSDPPDWDDYWNRVGMALWRATGGSDFGWHLWNLWSQRNPAYDPTHTRERWEHYPHSQPNRIGAGTIFHLAREAREKRQTPPLMRRPTIKAEAGQISRLATEAEDALIGSMLPIFQRGGQLVRPLAWQVAASDERLTLAVGLKSIGSAALVDLLNQAAIFVKGRNSKPVDPPGKVASIILSRSGMWRVPNILGIITAPTLRRDGSIISEAGFDPTTRLFYMPDPNLHVSILDRPTREDAVTALELLTNLISGFKFVGRVDRAVALSGIISPIVRGALGMVPLHGISAPAAGSGKSYFVDVVSVIATGRICPVAAAAEDDPRETEKRLVGLLLAGFSVISLDNLSDPVGGDLLCQAVERPLIRLRALGSSEMIELESRALVFATAINMTVKGDMTRRALLAHIDAEEERPEDREFPFDPVARVLEDRGRYVAACLTIVRAYIAAGKPGRVRQLASYGQWSDLVRSALIWLGCDDPAASIGEARATDPVLDTLRQVLDAWEQLFGLDAALTVNAVIASLADQPDRPTELNLSKEDEEKRAEEAPKRDALRAVLALVGSNRRGYLDPARLAYWLRQVKNRIVGGKRFTVPRNARSGAAMWAVSSAKAS